MKRWAMALAALALFAAACSDGDAADPSTSAAQAATSSTVPAATRTTDASASTSTTAMPDPPPPEAADGFMTVISEDGDLVIQVPESVTEALTIDVLDPADWPAPLQGADSTGNVKIYDLGPSGAMFSEPVRVSRRLAVDTFVDLDLGPLDLPLVTLLTTREDGTYELLDGLAIIRRGSEIWVSGTTPHFSPVVASNERSPVNLRLAGDFLTGPAAPLSSLDPYWEAQVLHQRRAEISIPESTPSTVEGLPVHVHGDLDLPPLTYAELGVGIAAYEEQDAAAPSRVIDPDYDSPYVSEIVSAGGGRISDDMSVSLASYFKRIEPSSLPSTGPLLAWTPEGVAPAEESEAIEIGFGIVLITAQPLPGESPTGTRGTTAQVSISTHHNPIGPYPSNQPIEISLAELEGSTDSLWIFNFKDPPPTYDPDNPQSLIDLKVMSVVDAAFEENRLSAVLGIDCYCDFGYGLVEAGPGMPPPESGGDIGSLFEYGAVSLLGDPATGPVTVEVTAAEGEVFNGDTKVVPIGP